MCGIVAYIGTQSAQEILLDGLTRLEYRGYDSAGIALLQGSTTHIARARGKLSVLKEKLREHPLPASQIGIGHTRWATHGKPSEVNAHPHHEGPVTVVHNGIIENYLSLKEDLEKQGHHFSSETDSEILAHLVSEALKTGLSTREALQSTLKKVKGSYALALFNENEPDKIFGARLGSPLVVGFGKGEQFLASDVPALLPYTQSVYFLEEGDLVELHRDRVQVFDSCGKNKTVEPRKITWSLSMAEKEGFKHFMLKEIFEQSRALTDTLRGSVDLSQARVVLNGLETLFPSSDDFAKIRRIYLIACGTSWHAAQVSRYFLEPWSGVWVQVEQASEFRYRDPLVDEGTLVVAISQSGETADTLMAVRNAKAAGAKILGISNVVESSLARESHAVVYTHAGPEIGVAATKTFTAQLLALQLLGLVLGEKSGRLQAQERQEIFQAFMAVPQQVKRLLESSESIRRLALRYAQSSQFLFMGRGPQFPIALEGALKLKEISYLHAEGYPGGELKHGPIALIDVGSPVVALVPRDAYYDKMVSNIQEVLSRQASVIAVVESGETRVQQWVKDWIEVPSAHPATLPILTVIPLQLLAYFIADYKGHDVDQPRNLAKSVTVE